LVILGMIMNFGYPGNDNEFWLSWE